VLAPDRDAAAGAADAAGQARSGRRGSGRPVLLAGAGAMTAALALYVADVATHPAGIMLRWYDLEVYQQAGLVAQHAPATLYTWQFGPGIRFTYTPFAAMIFAAMSGVPWTVLAWSMTAASVAALVTTCWLVFGSLGWQGSRRAGAALAVSAAALWSEPVLRALHLGQVELLLMALVVWDLTGPQQRWWRGAGIGAAAGIKLVPLIFVPYLLLTRRFRQAGVAAAAFAFLALAGYAVLPQASRQWWLGPAFLRPGRTGFVAYVENQSLRALAARTAGSIAASGGAWLMIAAATGVAGLATAAWLHRSGQPVAGWVTCALTGLLISPISWDHHWVWLAPGLAVLVALAAQARRASRWAWYAAAAALAAVFAGWPEFWQRTAALTPVGLIWYAPGSGPVSRSHAEYHWSGLTWLAGNLYLLAGLVTLAAIAVAVLVTVLQPHMARLRGVSREA
jgi:Glycosyltransferase family 87